jgi:dihydroorotase
VHCEDETTIKKFRKNTKQSLERIFLLQRTILSEVKRPVPLQSVALRKTERLHVFHLSTAKEMDLFTNKIPLEDKKITAEFVFITFGLPMMIMLLRATIKWNPAVKQPMIEKCCGKLYWTIRLMLLLKRRTKNA